MTQTQENEVASEQKDYRATWITLGSILAANALLGLIVFEVAWHKSRRFRNPIPELEEQMPTFRRRDAPQWRKWTMYPGAMTMMLPRVFFFILFLFLTVSTLWLIMLGHRRGTPLARCRSMAFKLVIKVGLFFIIGTFALIMRSRYLTPADVDHYQEYLGSPDE